MTIQQTVEPQETFTSVLGAIADNMARAVQGKDDVIQLVLLCLVAEGHLLLEDVPGVGKTSLAKALAASIDSSFGRVQFTPDVLPTDVLGVNVWDRGAEEFRFRPGPVFANILLADEINRASPKTQSALLESMAEGQVTIDGVTYPLPPPFLVVATQNPIEQQGVYPLPEAQLDRFLFKQVLAYPTETEERAIVARHGMQSGQPDPAAMGVAQAVEPQALESAARGVAGVRLDPEVIGYIVALVRATRESADLETGASPRSAAALAVAARARAALDGRDYVIPDDVKALALPALRHRVILSPAAEIEGRKIDAAVQALIDRVEAPR